MARNGGNTALLALGGLALVALLYAAQQTEPEPTPPKLPPPPKPPTPPKPRGKDEETDDETALARMLASEDSKRNVQIVIGWITVQRARARKVSLYQLITSGMGYGLPQRGDVHLYASTVNPPTQATRLIAQQLLIGALVPSKAIRAHRPGSWVERKVKKTVSDDYIMGLQDVFDEGIYGRIAGTNWVLYSSDYPKIKIAPYKDATARLNALPQIPPVDPLLA
jgi:hypothetical protein